jgi:hypothetical protein
MNQMKTIKAIDTIYRGYRFRSRLEARWAVFMDAINVRFEYEGEGFAFDGVAYLPDFFLPDMDCFLEIKPTDPSEEEVRKAELLCEHTGKNVYILVGQPSCPCHDTPNQWYGNNSQMHAYRYSEWGVTGESSVDYDHHHLWCECPKCGKIGIEFDGRAERIDCQCGCGCASGLGGCDRRYNFDSPRLVSAYNAARGYRFEFNTYNSR